jgi:hypothetical protein
VVKGERYGVRETDLRAAVDDGTNGPPELGEQAVEGGERRRRGRRGSCGDVSSGGGRKLWWISTTASE